MAYSSDEDIEVLIHDAHIARQERVFHDRHFDADASICTNRNEIEDVNKCGEKITTDLQQCACRVTKQLPTAPCAKDPRFCSKFVIHYLHITINNPWTECDLFLEKFKLLPKTNDTKIFGIRFVEMLGEQFFSSGKGSWESVEHDITRILKKLEVCAGVTRKNTSDGKDIGLRRFSDQSRYGGSLKEQFVEGRIGEVVSGREDIQLNDGNYKDKAEYMKYDRPRHV